MIKKGHFLFIVVFLFVLNFFCWKEIFALSQRPALKVSFLDVGQGDSVFIETPQNHHILIDGGPNSAVLEKMGKLLPFWDKTIDLVILTHPEKDHMTGIMNILQKYNVKNFLWTGVVKEGEENKKLAELLNKAQNPSTNFLTASLNIKPETTKVIIAQAGQEIRAGDVVIDTLFPLENLDGKEIKNTSNDTCVVSKLIFKNSSFIFACDISFSGEKKILDAGENVSANVLKVAHHGSKYSTSELFLENVKPEVAVIEVGKNNYGHPTSEVLQRLEKFGIKIFRTDKNGDIQIISDGNNLKIIN